MLCFTVVTGYKDQFWIGLTDVEFQMRFRWIDNSTVTYTNWASGEPNNWSNREEDCVAMVINSNQVRGNMKHQ